MSSSPNEPVWTAVAPNLCSRPLWEIAYPSDGINSEFIGLDEFEVINKHATSSEVLCCAKRYLDHAFRHRVAAGAVIGVSAPTQAATRGAKQADPTAILFSTGLQVLLRNAAWEQIYSKSAGLPPLGSASRALGRTSVGMSHSAEFLRALPPQSISMLKYNLMYELEAAATAPARQLLELAGASIAVARTWVEAALDQALASQSTPSGAPALTRSQNGAVSVWRSYKQPAGGAVAQVRRSTAGTSLAAGQAADDFSMPFVAVLETTLDRGQEKGNRRSGGGSSSSSSSAAGHRSRLEARLLHWTDALPALLARRHVMASGASHEGAATAPETGPASSASSSAAVAPPGLPPAVASGTGPGAAHSGDRAPSSSAAAAPAEAGTSYAAAEDSSSGKPSASMLWRSIAASKRGPPVAVQQPGPARPATRAGAAAGAGTGKGKGAGRKKEGGKGKAPLMSVREAEAVASRAPRLLCRVTKWHMKGHHGRLMPVEPSALLEGVHQDDLYCHYEQVSYANEYCTVLRPGQEVECGIGPDPQRLATFVATRVTLPGGGQVTGYPRGRFDMLFDPDEKKYVTRADLDNPCFSRPPGGGGGGGRGGRGKGKGKGSHENGGRRGAGQHRERERGGGRGRTSSAASASSRPSGGAAKGPKLAADPSSAGAAEGAATRAGTGSSNGASLGGGADGGAAQGKGPGSRTGWSGWAAQKRDGSAYAKSGGKG